MNSIELAEEYLNIFFQTQNFDELRKILHQNLEFIGPYYKFNSAEDYINSLKENPPYDCSYDIISSTWNESSANVIYTFRKPGVETLMSQFFKIKNSKIIKIILIFDTAVFNFS
ncbi:MAG: hypothetical protein D8M61_10165 [Ignavibacteriae bacterium]|nr:hypothetical protein [Ignavibacteriota bacterium]